MFSACHTVMNPEYLREELEESREKGKGFQTSEEFVGRLEKAYPNLRLVVGYETIAPGTDKIFESITPHIETLNKGYKEFGDLALKASENYFEGWVGHEKDSTGWRYDTDKEGQRMAYYLKGGDGMWRYYSLDHPEGVPLDFEKSNEIYKKLYKKG